MNKNNIGHHFMVSELAYFDDCETNIRIDESTLLQDIRFFMQEYFIATFTTDGKELKISFNNAQAFTVTIKEIKEIPKAATNLN